MFFDFFTHLLRTATCNDGTPKGGAERRPVYPTFCAFGRRRKLFTVLCIRQTKFSRIVGTAKDMDSWEPAFAYVPRAFNKGKFADVDVLLVDREALVRALRSPEGPGLYAKHRAATLRNIDGSMPTYLDPAAPVTQATSAEDQLDALAKAEPFSGLWTRIPVQGRGGEGSRHGVGARQAGRP